VASVLYPFLFQPRFKERVWGGRNLERLYGKSLPAGQIIGESWEITDRPGDVSVIANGPLAGKDLRWLMENHAADLLGNARALNGRFPLLIKLLDAQEKLSLQVHPPAHKAAELGGEPKTEMWYVAHARPGSELYAGLKRGVTRADFEQKIHEGTVADCFHRIPVSDGAAMFLPSGRVHAIGAGLVLFEIQQNSDTTYRVYDWGRVGLDGKPRELHVEQSLASIDFSDSEPALAVPVASELPNGAIYHLVQHPLFAVELWKPRTNDSALFRNREMQIVGVVSGSMAVGSASSVPTVKLDAGEFCLIPAGLPAVELTAAPGSSYLRVTCGAEA
jgi:mannose-6-phosphate isomerase